MLKNLTNVTYLDRHEHCEIKFTRQRISFVMNVVLPIILINMVLYRILNLLSKRYLVLYNTFSCFQICIATNFFPEDHFDTIVAVNLTALLVMVTLFNDATAK